MIGEQFWKHGETVFKLRVLSYQWQFCKFPANMSPTAMSRPITAGFCEQRIFFLITLLTTRGVVERMEREANEILWERREEERGITRG